MTPVGCHVPVLRRGIPVRARLLAGAGMLCLLPGAVLAADSGVPALLQFAEKYQSQEKAPVEPAKKPQPVPTQPAPARPAPVERPGAARPSVPGEGGKPSRPSLESPSADLKLLRAKFLASERQLSSMTEDRDRLQSELAALRIDLAEAKKAGAAAVAAATASAASAASAAAVPVTPPDLSLFNQWIGGLRTAWRGTPDEHRSVELVRQSRQAQELAEGQVTLVQEKNDALTQEVGALSKKLEAQRQESDAEMTALQSALREAEKAGDKSEQQLAAERTQLADVQKALEAARQQVKWTVSPEQLEKEEALGLAYAAGSALGRDIQSTVAERERWGLSVNRQGLLAGVIDAVSGQLQLPEEKVEALVQKADADADAARKRWVDGQQQRDEAFRVKFVKEKGVKQSPAGFWYRVDYAGKGELAKDAMVDVVVKETLTDGTVIQDMGATGKVLSQPLSAYPPLFQEAIGHLNNHGSLTMVVPPALAYGEVGYPPAVPPNATMVYTLRIDNSWVPRTDK